jgi:hypothetical protein
VPVWRAAFRIHNADGLLSYHCLAATRWENEVRGGGNFLVLMGPKVRLHIASSTSLLCGMHCYSGCPIALYCPAAFAN